MARMQGFISLTFIQNRVHRFVLSSTKLQKFTWKSYMALEDKYFLSFATIVITIMSQVMQLEPIAKNGYLVSILRFYANVTLDSMDIGFSVIFILDCRKKVGRAIICSLFLPRSNDFVNSCRFGRSSIAFCLENG